MGVVDWGLVLFVNGAIIVHALIRTRRAESTSDWFLGGRSVPWWIVGVSAFATAIDSSDIVADAGGVYSLGISYFVTNWVGTVVGWVLLAHFVALPMYRAGMYTNSEYLEARFGPTARVLSSLVQVQYRTMVMANISTTLFLTFAVVGGLGDSAWWVVAHVVLVSLSLHDLGWLRFGGVDRRRAKRRHDRRQPDSVFCGLECRRRLDRLNEKLSVERCRRCPGSYCTSAAKRWK